jgi:glycosyltransferase involved in cell wall biosynthesis
MRTERPELGHSAGSAGTPAPKSAACAISVVIPMRNEEHYIGPCLDSLLHQTCSLDDYEIVVVDGRSTDGSMDVVREFQKNYGNIRVLDNPAGIVPTAMNLGIASARGDLIIRADAHSTYPAHYIATCVETLEETGAHNVGGPVTTVPANHTFQARLVAAVLSNRFGVGDSRFRTSTTSGYVDTVPFGAFRREVLDRIGYFNEELGRNEDNDLNARIWQSGGKVYMTPKLALNYFPAGTFRRFLRNNYKSSEWHLYTLYRNPGAMGLRHLVPALFVLTIAILLTLSFTSRTALLMLSLILGIYLLASLFFAVRDSKDASPSLVMAMPFAFFGLHLTYGLATLAGFRFLIKKPLAKPTR